MSISSFVPEIWSAALLASLKKSHVYANLCNTDYEGEIAQAGDTVHINSVSRPTVNDYVAGSTTITPEQLTTADRTLVIDQAKYFAFEVDDIDARQARGNLIDAAMTEAAYALADVSDQFIAGLYSGVQASNVVSSGGVSVTSGDIAYTQLTKLGQKLNEANVVMSGRFAVIPPWYLQLLLDSSRIAANPALAQTGQGEQAVVEGFVGRLAGMDLFVSNNVPNITGSRWAVIGGTKAAMSYAEQISKTEAYRPQSSFADAVKGLHLYGAKLVRPDGLAYIDASTS